MITTTILLTATVTHAAKSFAPTIDDVQPKIVKIFGAGGLQRLEAYQSGFLISDDGHVLTVWSYVLDTDDLSVILNDGRRFKAELVGADPRLEIAVLKIEANDLPYFELTDSVELRPGTRVLAFSNLFGVATGDESASVQHGSVAAVGKLTARQGVYETPYRGSAYVLDAMTNNPGAAGGALTDRRGRLAAMLGKELVNARNNTWLNYAVPMIELEEAVGDLLAGRARPRDDEPDRRRPPEPITAAMLGLVLVPNIVTNTPPYIDRVVRESPADLEGLQPDDLVLFVNGELVRSTKKLVDELSYIDRIDEVQLIVQRGQELIEVSLFVD